MLKSWPFTLEGPDLNMFLDFWGLGSQGFIPTPPPPPSTFSPLQCPARNVHGWCSNICCSLHIFLQVETFRCSIFHHINTQQEHELQSGPTAYACFEWRSSLKGHRARRPSGLRCVNSPRAWHVAGTDQQVSGFSSFPIHRAWPAESER